MTHWLTIAEAAEYVRAKGDQKIRGAIRAGELPARLYGNEYRIDASDLDAWLKPWEPK
jgi:excisionase family DNA binding protein